MLSRYTKTKEPIVTYEVKTPNQNPVVSLEDLKRHCLVDFPDDDELIEDLGRAAEEFAEIETGFGIGLKTITVYSDGNGEGWLPLTPVIDGDIEKIGANRFKATKNENPGIDMEVGFDSSTLPYGLKLAICKMVAQAYWKREDQSIDSLHEVIFNSGDLLAKFRRRVLL
ncbi:Phage gp6-like head-tail connector protein [Arachidicoccus rhizosphaerae]|uniref:Phage gp6-like head-tail connector protein n=1 Tax=Arachidicoccus rhizosphaerae TaxID=551991 RepID=A0A1H3W517_9BACT|nr:head-tail connector protein [Arachidicoccus rhizosphaerae]SDZ82219.1 Phage gp6-like head-tail connector protein [Arachidicoccus rhizosphaerae]